MRLILASQSPARRALLAAFSYPFHVVATHVDETPRAKESPERLVKRLARTKAAAVVVRQRGTIVIGVDTVVVCAKKIFGKPRTISEARRMLRVLSGRWHAIVTGVAVRHVARGRTIVCVVKTRVKFAKLSRQHILRYTKTAESLGKAGGYAIQGNGAALIAGIRGSLTNVIGLPVERLPFLLSQLQRGK